MYAELVPFSIPFQIIIIIKQKIEKIIIFIIILIKINYILKIFERLINKENIKK
jgi:hypothetical protein